MNKKILMVAIFGIFLISFVSAIDFKVDEEVNLTITCLDNGYCLSSAQCNINIINPDGEIIVNGENMTYATNYFYYTITNTLNGEYLVTGFCIDGVQDEINYKYAVTPNGDSLNSGKSLLFIGVLVILIVLIIMTINGMVNINDFGWTFGFINIAYLLFNIFFFTSWKVASNYIYTIPTIGSALHSLWIISNIAWVPFILSQVAWIALKMTDQKEMNNLIDKGWSETEARKRLKK